MNSAAGAEEQNKNLQSPDLVHQTSVGVTFSYAKKKQKKKSVAALFKSLALHKCQNGKKTHTEVFSQAFTKQTAKDFNIPS